MKFHKKLKSLSYISLIKSYLINGKDSIKYLKKINYFYRLKLLSKL